LANAPWGSRPHMLIIPEVAVAVRLSSLLRGDVALMNVRAREPDLLLGTNEQGEGNWEFGPPDEPAGAPPTPIIEDLQITHAAIRYRVPGREQDLLAQLDTVAGAIAGAGLRLSAQGTLNEEPLSVRLESAPVERLEPASAAERFPFQLEARLGPTQITATGSAERPLEAEGLRVEIALESEQPEALLALAGREAPELDPLGLSLGLTREGDLWSLHDIDLRLGGSDLRGDAAFSMGGEVPALSAALRSSEIRLAEVRDLVAMLGGDSGPVPGRPTLEATVADAQDALEPAAAAEAQRAAGAGGLAQLEAEVSWQVERLSGPDLLVRDLGFYGGMRDRLPYLVLSGEGHYQSEPVTLAVRLGDATGQADPYPIRARIEAGATQVALEGVIGAPEALEGLDLQVQASSEDINRVLALGDIDLPPIPPFAVSGHMVQDGEVWRIADFYGQFSESDLAGELTFDLSGRRPFVSADLRSNRLLVSDLVTAGDRAAVV